jgi:hypothetical protein
MKIILTEHNFHQPCFSITGPLPPQITTDNRHSIVVGFVREISDKHNGQYSFVLMGQLRLTFANGPEYALN